MAEFIGREEDLRLIQETYDQRKFVSCALIGRRRIGKSRLIQEFVSDKKHIYFEFVKGLPVVNLRVMEMVMGEFKGHEVEYRDFIEAFSDLSDVAKKEKMVIVFDEFTYACSYESFPSLTKNLIDRGLGDSFLILCGSIVKMMEDELFSYSKPLYGRTRRIDIKGIRLEDCRAFHPDMSDIDLLRLHVLSGGSPYYLADTPAETLEEYFDRYILPLKSYFHDEGEQIIRREIDAPVKYIDILDALAIGRDTVKMMSDYTKIDETTVKSLLRRMEELGIIARINPMYGAPQKPVLYRFSDGIVELHFRILRGNPFGQSVKYSMIEKRVLTEIGRLFEPYASEFLKDNYPVLSIGSWFAKIPVEDGFGTVKDDNGKVITEMTDIDVVADIFDDPNKIQLFVECKLRDAPCGMGEMKELERRLRYVHGKYNYRLMLISAGGFTEDLIEYSETFGIMLIDMDVICGRKPIPRV